MCERADYRMEATKLRRQDQQTGVAIIIALVFTVVVTGLVFSGTIMLRAASTQSVVKFRVESQATQFARSGLTDALNWLRRQTSQPVAAFNPILDTSADPQILDTDEPEIGLVREFEIEGDVWGRYEVWKEWDADPDAKRLAWRKQYECKDITGERGVYGSGNVWFLRAVGYVFLRRDSNKPYNAKPNRILSSVLLGIEVRRLSLQPPTQTALSVHDGGLALVQRKGRIRGGTTGAGIYYPTGTGTPATGSPGQNRVLGSPPLLSNSSYDGSVFAVFGVSEDALRATATLVITDANDFPDPLPQNALVFCEVSNITFDSTRALNGTAVVYIKGDVTLAIGNNSNFNGLLYIDGNLTMRQPSVMNGSVIVTDDFFIKGSGDYATIYYDDDVLNTLRTEIGQYRWSSPVRDLRGE